MSFSFGAGSLAQLNTLDERLIVVLRRALTISPLDFKILEGFRNREAQEAAFVRGETQLHWPKGKHNYYPSLAVDLAPSPIEWNDKERFVLLAGAVMAAAKVEGIKLRWGGDWDVDGHLLEEKFRDYGHFELV